jgi:hypothetical protein
LGNLGGPILIITVGRFGSLYLILVRLLLSAFCQYSGRIATGVGALPAVFKSISRNFQQHVGAAGVMLAATAFSCCAEWLR